MEMTMLEHIDAYKGSSSGDPHTWINQNGSSGQIAFPTVIVLMCEPYVPSSITIC